MYRDLAPLVVVFLRGTSPPQNSKSKDTPCFYSNLKQQAFCCRIVVAEGPTHRAVCPGAHRDRIGQERLFVISKSPLCAFERVLGDVYNTLPLVDLTWKHIFLEGWVMRIVFFLPLRVVLDLTSAGDGDMAIRVCSFVCRAPRSPPLGSTPPTHPHPQTAAVTQHNFHIVLPCSLLCPPDQQHHHHHQQQRQVPEH